MKHLLLLSLLAIPALGMDTPIPQVELKQPSICGKCGHFFEINQKATVLFPCNHLIHDKCLPQLFYVGKECAVCDQEINRWKSQDVTFIQPTNTLTKLFSNQAASLAPLGLNLDPIFLARALILNKNNHRAAISKLKNEISALYRGNHNLHDIAVANIQNAQALRNKLLYVGSGIIGAAAAAAAYTYIPDIAPIKACASGLVAAGLSYCAGDIYTTSLYNADVHVLNNAQEEINTPRSKPRGIELARGKTSDQNF